MRRLALLTLLVSAVHSRAAESEIPMPPPAYGALRFNEDYSYLQDAMRRTDILDSLKYLRLSPTDSSWYLSLGGEARERLEITSHPDFRFSGEHDGVLLQRFSLYADLHLGGRVRSFVQGISGLVEGGQREASPVQDNPLDLQYGFIDVVPWISGAERVTLRMGRFGLSLGAGRLVATRAAPNIPNKFDGAELLYQNTRWAAVAFLTRPGEERPHGFDYEDDDTTFWGAYVTRWFTDAHKDGADLYYLGLQRENSRYASGTGTQTRHSLGARMFGAARGWDWDTEAVGQFGRFSHDQDILAWTLSLDTGYTLETLPGRPRLGLKFDVASGDSDPHDHTQGTFDPLFFKSGYFNDASLLRPSNLIDLHPNITVQATSQVTLNGGVDVFWRYSARDAIYDPPGFIQVPVTVNRSRYLGSALDVNLTWRLQRHALLSASYVYFFSDNFIRSAGGGSTGFFSTTLSLQF